METGFRCFKSILVVYDARTGNKVAETAGHSFKAAAFMPPGVIAIDDGLKKAPSRVQLTLPGGAETRQNLTLPPRFKPECVLPNGDLAGIRFDKTIPTVAVIHDGSVQDLPQPDLENKLSGCAGRTRGSSLLMESGFGKSALHWISTEFKPPVPCATFSERIFNKTLSPDGSVIAVITAAGDNSEIDDTVMGPAWKVHLRVLTAPACTQIKTFELQFPETPKLKAPLLAPKNQYWATAKIRNELARTIAISPDNSKVAVGYGVRADGIYSDGTAFFGIYSLQDGHRMATLRGDTFENGLLHSLAMIDARPTYEAPLDGILRFSTDSKTLFGSSIKLRHWDLSKLQ